MSHHTVSVQLENKPGALARVSQLFARRGYNIQSLAVGPTERPGISRLTLRVDCSEHSLEQIEKQMHKLVNVLRVDRARAPTSRSSASCALITVGAPPDKRAELIALGEVFGGARRRHRPRRGHLRDRRPAGGARRASRSSSVRTASASSRAPADRAPRPGRAHRAAAGTSLLSERNHSSWRK